MRILELRHSTHTVVAKVGLCMLKYGNKSTYVANKWRRVFSHIIASQSLSPTENNGQSAPSQPAYNLGGWWQLSVYGCGGPAVVFPRESLALSLVFFQNAIFVVWFFTYNLDNVEPRRSLLLWLVVKWSKFYTLISHIQYTKMQKTQRREVSGLHRTSHWQSECVGSGVAHDLFDIIASTRNTTLLAWSYI